jgi:hypothetical protein
MGTSKPALWLLAPIFVIGLPSIDTITSPGFGARITTAGVWYNLQVSQAAQLLIWQWAANPNICSDNVNILSQGHNRSKHAYRTTEHCEATSRPCIYITFKMTRAHHHHHPWKKNYDKTYLKRNKWRMQLHASFTFDTWISTVTNLTLDQTSAWSMASPSTTCEKGH